MTEQAPGILHISTAHSWRGGEQQVAYLLENLHKQNVAVGLIAARDGKLARWARTKNFPLREATKKTSLPLGFARLLADFFKEGAFDLVHAHDSHAHTAAILAARFFGMKAKIVVSRRVDFPVGQNWFSRYKYNHPQVKAILCVSKAIKEVMKGCIARPERLRVVYSGIDLEKFPAKPPGNLRREYNIPDHRLLIGNVAALADHKDYPTFIDTVAKLQRSGLEASFFIIGTGPLEQKIKAYAAEKQVTLIFTGFREDVTEVLPELDILLFTSKMEGLGSTVLDAFAAGTAVVATAGGGIPELVKHNETGLLAAVGDSEGCAKHVTKLANEPPLRAALRDQARKFVQGFSLQHTALRTLAVYRQIVAGNEQ